MKEGKIILAWSKNPEPNGTLYYETELVDPQTVIDLFSYCQSSTAYINSNGWEFLFETFGMEGLLDLKIKSGWINSLAKHNPVSDLVYQSFISGYNPLHQ